MPGCPALPLVEIIPTDKYDFFDYEAESSPGPPMKSARPGSIRN